MLTDARGHERLRSTILQCHRDTQKAKKPPAEAAVSSRINLLPGLAIACPQKLPDLRQRSRLPAQVGQVRAVSWLVGRSKPKPFHTTKDGWQKRDKQHGRTSAPLQLLHPRPSAWLTGCPPTNMPGDISDYLMLIMLKDPLLAAQHEKFPSHQPLFKTIQDSVHVLPVFLCRNGDVIRQ